MNSSNFVFGFFIAVFIVLFIFLFLFFFFIYFASGRIASATSAYINNVASQLAKITDFNVELSKDFQDCLNLNVEQPPT